MEVSEGSEDLEYYREYLVMLIVPKQYLEKKMLLPGIPPEKYREHLLVCECAKALLCLQPPSCISTV